MKIFKKVLRALVILLVIATYFNIGYYGGKGWKEGAAKLFQNEPLNNFQKFQRVTVLMTTDNPKDNVLFNTGEIDKIVSIFFWPLGLILSLILWAVYGIGQAAIGVWHVLVFLFNFFFAGGFFKLLGTIGYHWILK